MPVGEQAYPVEFIPVGADYRACVLVHCSLGETVVRVFLDDNAISVLLDGVVSAGTFQTLADFWQLALLEAAMAPLADTARQQLGMVLTLKQVDPVSEPVPVGAGGLLFAVKGSAALPGWSAVIKIEDMLPPEVTEWFRQSAEIPQAGDYGWLPLLVKLEIGYTSLSLFSVESLKPGDIILCDSCYLSERQWRVNIDDYFFCFAGVEGDNLTVQVPLEKVMEEELTVPEAENETQAPDDADDVQGQVADLPVDVVFVAGRLNVTVSELQQIRPGYVFDLRQNSDRRVDICAKGVTLGRGELVEVDGRTGVRILEWK